MNTQLKPGDEIVPLNFDPDLSPEHEHNRRAAALRKVRFDKKSGYYKDADGCLAYDSYGQPL
jgi:hypothetical protein